MGLWVARGHQPRARDIRGGRGHLELSGAAETSGQHHGEQGQVEVDVIIRKTCYSEDCLQNRAVLSAEEGCGGDQLPGGEPEPVHGARVEVPGRGGQDGPHTLHAGPATLIMRILQCFQLN